MCIYIYIDISFFFSLSFFLFLSFNEQSVIDVLRVNWMSLSVSSIDRIWPVQKRKQKEEEEEEEEEEGGRRRVNLVNRNVTHG